MMEKGVIVRFSYLVDILAGKLGDQGLDTISLGLNTDGGKEGGDVSGRGGGLATKGEQKVSGEILHGDYNDSPPTVKESK
jgi:hypothetical protein